MANIQCSTGNSQRPSGLHLIIGHSVLDIECWELIHISKDMLETRLIPLADHRSKS